MALCLHCEKRDRVNNDLRLCVTCAQQPCIVRLYRKTIDWCPAWDANIQRLVERAKKKLPLFPRAS